MRGCAMALRVRGLTDEEGAGWGRRGEPAPAVARRLGVGPDVFRQWIKRFNAAGLAGLEDRPRAGRPATYTAEQVGQVLAAAVTDPQALGLPFGCWTLDRLTAYLHERPPEAGG